ncbi:hypothetical protein Tco_0869321 [Tanacetum coccineum]
MGIIVDGGIAKLAHLLLGKVVEEGEIDYPWRWPRNPTTPGSRLRIKVQSPSSASSGVDSILKPLHSSKYAGKAQFHNDSSPVDSVLDKMAYDKSILEKMVFSEGVKDCDMKSSNAVKIGSNVIVEDFKMVDNTLSIDNVSVHNVADVEHVIGAHVTHVDKKSLTRHDPEVGDDRNNK